MIQRKKSILCICLSLCLIFVGGCAQKKSEKKIVKSTIDSVQAATIDEGKESNTNTVPKQEKKESIVPVEEEHGIIQNLSNMRQSAENGTLINCKYKIEESNIYDVEKELGKADSCDMVAGGNYSTYSSYKLVLGWNKGGQIFEIRSMNPLTNTPYYMVEEVYGKPDYSVEVNGEKIIGYKVNDKYKMLLVFESNSINAKVDHYSVERPELTENSMSGYPGREW